MHNQKAIVYGNYTQAELNAQYDQTTLVPDLGPYLAYWRAGRDLARETLDCRLDVAYGPHPRQVMDIFPAGMDTPVIVHFHGGAWRRQEKSLANFPAPVFVGKGATFIAVDFALAIEVSLDEMVAHVRAAISWIYNNAASYGGNNNKLFLSGHSSGSHLAAMLLANGWRKNAGLPEDVIKGATLTSGLYDLIPVRLSSRNEYLHLDKAAVERNSPVLHIPRDAPPLIVAWGENDLDEFRRQSDVFVESWHDAGNTVETLMLPGKNHFDMSNAIAEPNELLVGKMLMQMGLV